MTLSRRRQSQQEAMRAAMSEPIPCECARCGGEAVILPTPDGKGVCVCRAQCGAEEKASLRSMALGAIRRTNV